MEELPNFELRETFIDKQIEELAVRENMNPDFISADIILFAPSEGNESVNLEYLSEMAEKLEISIEEMHAYARKAATSS